MASLIRLHGYDMPETKTEPDYDSKLHAAQITLVQHCPSEE